MFLTVLLIAVAAAATVSAQTTLQVDLTLRALSNDDISKYKLPSDVQRSGGLSTIGLGQPAYLEARVDTTIPANSIANVSWNLAEKPSNASAVLADGPLGADVLSFEPSDRQAFRVVGRQMLRPDVAGRYRVTVTVTAKSGVTATASTTITAATYVGIESCAKCHSNGPAKTPWSMANSWSTTAHASIFKDGMNGVASDHYGPNCVSCHTVGYDANPVAVNGGFDDIAAQLKWTWPTTLQPGTFEALPNQLKNVGNIQCENCHGPGSQHASNGGDTRMISVSHESGACGQCHGALNNHFKMAEWSNSGHAVAPRDPSGAGREGCVGCHTAGGFIQRMKGQKITDTQYDAINCQTCHDPHGRTEPDGVAHLVRSEADVTLADGTVLSGVGAGALCMNCHQSRQNAVPYATTTPGSARFGPHHGPQADMLAGTNGYTYGLSIPSSAHFDAADETCVTCHMQTVATTDPNFTNAGGHTFKMSWTDAKNAKHELVGACQGCHGQRLTTFNFKLLDYNGDGKIEGAQTEVQRLLDQLGLLLPPVGKAKTSLTIDATWTRAQLLAAYNWQFVAEDRSMGVHNMAYAVGLLKASIADLGGKK